MARETTHDEIEDRDEPLQSAAGEHADDPIAAAIAGARDWGAWNATVARDQNQRDHEGAGPSGSGNVMGGGGPGSESSD